jgi:ABC-type transport system involved in multi-copper enzyme maturation permease subunit
MFGKLLAIAANTFTETVRQPIYGVLMWVALGMLALNPFLAAFSLESGGDVKIVKDVGLATMLLYGLFASVFAATSVITREIESQTVLTVVSKPISRTTFLLGKYLGVCGAVLVGYYFLSLGFLLSVRHGVLETVQDKIDGPVVTFLGLAVLISVAIAAFGNYVYGWHFSATLTYAVVPLSTMALLAVLCINKEWKLQAPGDDISRPLLYAVILTYCGVLILTAFAVALSTRFTQVVTLMLCAVIYVAGLLSDYYLGRGGEHHWLLSALYAIVPNFQFFWIGDALTQDLGVPIGHVGRVAAYAVVYSLAVLSLGVALFQTREVG